MEPESEHTYSLVFPFVVVESNGGTLKDFDFVAGVQYGEFEAAVKSVQHFNGHLYRKYVMPVIVPQLDLLAMNMGWYMKAEPHSDDWTLVTFSAEEFAAGASE